MHTIRVQAYYRFLSLSGLTYPPERGVEVNPRAFPRIYGTTPAKLLQSPSRDHDYSSKDLKNQLAGDCTHAYIDKYISSTQMSESYNSSRPVVAME